MKRTRKKIFGFLGLLAVVAVTFFAATLPVPETSAATTTSVTDQITVRVVDGRPGVKITNIVNGEVTTIPEQTFSVQFSAIGILTVELTHTDMDGVTTHSEVITHDTDYNPGQLDFDVNIIK